MFRLTLILTVALSTQVSLSQDRDFLVRSADVFDGYEVHRTVDVLIRDGLIAEIGQDLVAQGVPIVDGSSATLMPGLIDAHVHIYDAVLLRDALRFGVTTVVDLGSDGTALTSRQDASDRFDVADVRAAGFAATAPGGHGTEYGFELPTISDSNAAAQFVADRVADSVDHIKLIINGSRAISEGTPSLDSERVLALVEAAHNSGLKALAHVETRDDVQMALDAGVDILTHHWRDAGSDPRLARMIADRGASFTG